MSSTHLVEFGVREASLCANALRSERVRSIYALIRSVIGKAANRSVVSVAKNAERHAIQHMTTGKKGRAGGEVASRQAETWR
jgi:hypothetical protein